MIDLAPELVLQIMDNRSRGGDGLRHLPAAKSVERCVLEVFAQGEDCLFGQKRVTVVAKRIRDFLELLLLLIGDEKLRRRNARKLVSSDCRSCAWVKRNSPVLRSAYAKPK